MLTNTMLVLSVVSAAMMASLVAANDNLSIAYEWKEIDFAYRTQQDRADAIASGEFVAANVIPVGLEVYQHRLFLTLPRLKTGVPASLAYINLNGKKDTQKIAKYILVGRKYLECVEFRSYLI